MEIKHAGQLLKEKCEELKISGYSLAKDIGVSNSTITRLFNLETKMTCELALKLESCQKLKLKANTWMKYQVNYDIYCLREVQVKNTNKNN
ncbi:putative HigA family addiction module antitoxin [Vibrio phage 249E41-1]|nr:putative HigA family addiction module antitoxin [Vibrio phage 249E41-1]CAH9017544.1 putative HigA family addiction module antitoxin [Vibrio phage 193E37-1]